MVDWQTISNCTASCIIMQAIIYHIFGSHRCEETGFYLFFIETVEESLSAYYSVIQRKYVYECQICYHGFCSLVHVCVNRSNSLYRVSSSYSSLQQETFTRENFMQKTFTDCSLVLPIVPPEDTNFRRENFCKQSKKLKIRPCFFFPVQYVEWYV